METNDEQSHSPGGSAAVTIRVDDAILRARPEQTVAAAMIEAGIDSWRITRRNGRPRGLFCGIGACFDCLVRIDANPSVRACLVPVRDGMTIRTDRSRDTNATVRTKRDRSTGRG